jgi:hypothetical protein
LYSVASFERSPSSSVRSFWLVVAAIRFSRSSSSGFSSSMRFCVVSRLGHRALAALDDGAQAVLRSRVAGVEDVLLVGQDADDHVGLRQQFLQIAGKRHVAHPFGAHPLHALLGEQADQLLEAGIGFHRLEFRAEHVGRVLQPDDEIRDIGFHHLLLFQHVLDTGVFDVEVGVTDGLVRLGEFFEHDAGLLDLGTHVVDDLFGLLDLGIKILQGRHESGLPLPGPTGRVSSGHSDIDCRNDILKFQAIQDQGLENPIMSSAGYRPVSSSQ